MERYHQRPLENHPDTFDWLFNQQLRLHVCDFEGFWRPGQCDSEHECNLVEAELRKHASKLQAWLEASDDIFWVQGKAGSGKSTFMKFLFEHEQTRVHLQRWAGGDVIVAAFFFWRAGSSELEKSYIGLLQGLLYQVLQERRELIELVLPQRWRGVLRSATYNKKPWTKSELVTAFDLLLQAPETHLRFCFFIDGLDEFDGDHRDLIDAIRSFGKSPFVKICVSSRPWGSFQREYGSDERLHVILHTLTKRDIDTYIATKLETAAYSAPGVYCACGLRQLGNAVYARSEGVFLWVALAVRDLRRGIEEQDSLSALHDRLEGYPSELRDFIQRIFNGIDPAYKRLTGRLLLMMLEDTGPPALITLNFLGDSFAADGEYIMDPHWSPRSDAEMYSLIDRAAMCANKWCRDLLLPVNTRDVKEKISTVLSERYSPRSRQVTLSFFAADVEFIHLISYLSFGHRLIHQFAEEKATDGTLSEMAGRKFDPRLAWLCTFVEISRCAPNLIEFIEVFTHASWLLLGIEEHNLVGIALEDKTLMNGIQQCLEAFDSIGQDIQKHSSWRHWTAERLAADGYRNPQLRSRMPAANDCSSFLSYLACLVFPDDFLSQVLTKHVSLTELQKQFVLETCLIPFFYSDSDADTIHHVDEDRRGPRSHCRIIVQIIESGIDVNRPTKRLICHQDYSVWQFFLLWLHDYFHENPLFRCGCSTINDVECCYTRNKALYVEDAIKIFRSFLRHGADPFVVISSTDLIECHNRKPLNNRATFLNVADVVHDLRTIAMSDSARFADENPWLDAHVAAVGDLETLLNEAYAQRYRASSRSEI